MQNGSVAPFRIGLVVALTCGLAGAVVPGPAAAAGPFDGVYRGAVTPGAGSIPGCLGATITVQVANSHINRFFDLAPFSLDVAADGTIAGSSMQTRNVGRGAGPVQFRGRIANGALTVDYGNARCRLHGDLTRR